MFDIANPSSPNHALSIPEKKKQIMSKSPWFELLQSDMFLMPKQPTNNILMAYETIGFPLKGLIKPPISGGQSTPPPTANK